MKQIFLEEIRQESTIDHWCLNQLVSHFWWGLQFLRLLKDIFPVHINQIIDHLFSKIFRDLLILLKPLTQKPHLIPTSKHLYISSEYFVFFLLKIMYICSMMRAIPIVERIIKTVTYDWYIIIFYVFYIVFAYDISESNGRY